MSQPLTKRERRLKRKLRRHEAILQEVLQKTPLIQIDGKVGVFIPVIHDPTKRGVKLVRQ